MKKVNEKLPKNVCVQVFDIKDFPILLEKLCDMWTGIVTPSQNEDEKIAWAMPYLKYDIEETHYLIWFFIGNGEPDIVKEVKQFLEDEKELENEDSGNIHFNRYIRDKIRYTYFNDISN